MPREDRLTWRVGYVMAQEGHQPDFVVLMRLPMVCAGWLEEQADKVEDSDPATAAMFYAAGKALRTEAKRLDWLPTGYA